MQIIIARKICFAQYLGDEMRTLKIEPYPKQVVFFKSNKRYIAYGGARGGGKSWAARTKAVLLALNYTGIQILILRRTLKELRENHVLPLMILLKGIAKYNAEAKEFNFPNGSRILLGYCQAESDVLQYQGQAYDVIFMEEATQFTEFQKDTLTESNRASGMMKERFTPRMYFTCNPGGVGHAWVKRLFVDKDYRNKENPDNYDFIPSTVYDNEFLMTNNPEYVENLENLPEMRKRAMLYGDWDAFDGQYFDEFNRDIHVIEPFIMPDYWRRYITIDYGLDMLAAYWIAVDERNKSYVYKELYQSGLIISEAAKAIKYMTNETIYQTLAPPDLWNRRQETGKSAAQLFQENGLYLMQSNNDRVQGWYNLKEWLKPYEDEQGIKTANLVITKNCTNLIRCLPMLQCDDKNPNDVANDPHELTHGPDAIRGYVAGRPIPAKIPQPRVNKQNTFNTEKNDNGGFITW
jgi:phage terminase large subunit